MADVTNQQSDSCLSEENPRKKQRIAAQSDVRCSCTCNSKTDGQQEWKLVLCHGSGQLNFHGIQKFFEDASRSFRLKGMQLGMVYGKRKVDEVSFWSEGDFVKAMEKSNLDTSVSSFPRITLKTPEDALEEMAFTEYYWHSLPFDLVKEILVQLSPFHWGRVFARVSRTWRNLTSVASHVYEGLFNINPHDGVNLGTQFNTDDLVEKEVQFDQSISHLVLVDPDQYRFHQWAKVLEINQHIKHLTISKATYFDAADMNFEDSASTFTPLWRHLERVTCLDCHLTFPYSFGQYDRAWMLTLNVPRLTLNIPEVCRTYTDDSDSDSENDEENEAEDKAQAKVMRANFVHQVMTAIKALDLWWPYPVEQSQWLQKGLEFVEHHIQRREEIHSAQKARSPYQTWSKDKIEGHGMEISGYLKCYDRNEWRSQKEGNSATNAVFEKQLLDKMDCAVIGQYLASAKIPGIEAPPCKWENSSFQNSSDEDDREWGFDKI